MDKILGEVFDEYVDKQIKVRQKSLAKHQKSADDLVVFNSSTPWIRLSSSVLVDEDKAKTLATNLGINQSEIVGSNLAKNLVLFAGTSDGANLSNRKGGVGYGLESSYGFLSDKEQGYKPMPGVTGITANYKNNGTLKQAQVKLTCFTRKQFEAIEAIYLRLGFTMLLEWGHSLYFDNKGVKQNMSALKVPNILFKKSLSDSKGIALAAVEEALKENPNLTSTQKDAIYFEEEQKARNYPTYLRTALQENKEKTSGNYDAMMAKVSNFSWTLNSDLSYSITLDLVSVGDIVDSLKMNFGGTNLTEDVWDNLEVDEGVRNLQSIKLNSGASAFNSFLSELVEVLDDPQVRNEFEPELQTKLELADKSRVQQELIEHIKNAYLKAIEARLAKFEPLQDARALLLENSIITDTKVNIGSTVWDFTSEYAQDYKYRGDLQELKKLLKEDGRIGSLSLPSDDGYLSYTLIQTLGLDIDTSRVETPFNPGGLPIPFYPTSYTIVESSNKNSFFSTGNVVNTILYNTDLEESKALAELRVFFADKLKAKPLPIWINLIDYLNRKKGSARDVIKLLLANRYFDVEEKFPLDKYQE